MQGQRLIACSKLSLAVAEIVQGKSRLARCFIDPAHVRILAVVLYFAAVLEPDPPTRPFQIAPWPRDKLARLHPFVPLGNNNGRKFRLSAGAQAELLSSRAGITSRLQPACVAEPPFLAPHKAAAERIRFAECTAFCLRPCSPSACSAS